MGGRFASQVELVVLEIPGGQGVECMQSQFAPVNALADHPIIKFQGFPHLKTGQKVARVERGREPELFCLFGCSQGAVSAAEPVKLGYIKQVGYDGIKFDGVPADVQVRFEQFA